jgi:hypothetical protein
MSIEDEIEAHFPNLRNTSYRIASPWDERYNCVSWAVGDDTRSWWPVQLPVRTGQRRKRRYYWPPECPLEESLDAFVSAFRTRGFEPCSDGEDQPGFEKVAIYAIASQPLHAARQLRSGMWTSKLGDGVDIEHTLEALEGSIYGTVVQFLKRPSLPARPRDH